MARYPNEAFKSKELSRRLSIRSQQDYQIFKDALRVLVDSNKVKRIKGGRFGHFEMPKSITGVLSSVAVSRDVRVARK